MSNEELLSPRYKVIEDYPYTAFHIGDIVKLEITERGTRYCTHELEFWADFNIEKFPKVFRKMKWWEDRDLSNYPKYISAFSPKHSKVRFARVKWKITDECVMVSNVDINEQYFFKASDYKDFLPATEEEYIENNK